MNKIKEIGYIAVIFLLSINTAQSQSSSFPIFWKESVIDEFVKNHPAQLEDIPIIKRNVNQLIDDYIKYGNCWSAEENVFEIESFYTFFKLFDRNAIVFNDLDPSEGGIEQSVYGLNIKSNHTSRPVKFDIEDVILDKINYKEKAYYEVFLKVNKRSYTGISDDGSITASTDGTLNNLVFKLKLIAFDLENIKIENISGQIKEKASTVSKAKKYNLTEISFLLDYALSASPNLKNDQNSQSIGATNVSNYGLGLQLLRRSQLNPNSKIYINYGARFGLSNYKTTIDNYSLSGIDLDDSWSSIITDEEVFNGLPIVSNNDELPEEQNLNKSQYLKYIYNLDQASESLNLVRIGLSLGASYEIKRRYNKFKLLFDLNLHPQFGIYSTGSISGSADAYILPKDENIFPRIYFETLIKNNDHATIEEVFANESFGAQYISADSDLNASPFNLNTVSTTSNFSLGISLGPKLLLYKNKTNINLGLKIYQSLISPIQSSSTNNAYLSESYLNNIDGTNSILEDYHEKINPLIIGLELGIFFDEKI